MTSEATKLRELEARVTGLVQAVHGLRDTEQPAAFQLLLQVDE